MSKIENLVFLIGAIVMLITVLCGNLDIAVVTMGITVVVEVIIVVISDLYEMFFGDEEDF